MKVGLFLLIEPFASVESQLKRVMELLGNPDALGVNLDTGNSWLGGSDPVEMARVFKDKIRHIHWKDLGPEWEEKRGKVYGCGFSDIALGDGVIDVAGVCEVMREAGIESSTLEIVGSDEILVKSREFLESQGMF